MAAEFRFIKVTPDGDQIHAGYEWNGRRMFQCDGEVAAEHAVMHDVCEGSVLLINTTRELKTLTCSRCFLRVPFPINLTTWGKVRDYFEDKLRQVAND